MSDVEAASIPYVGLTGWSTVVITGGFTPNNCYNKQVLIIGASGGLGTFLSQLLSAWGASVIIYLFIYLFINLNFAFFLS